MREPTIRKVPEGGVFSDYETACELGEAYGFPADPWQADLLRDILMEDETGAYLAPFFGYSAPRRNGKTWTVIILILYFTVILDKKVAYTAHLSTSAKEVWKPVLDLFEFSDLNQHVKKIIRQRGHETIELHDGGSFRLVTRTESGGAGRGSPADVLILDEAMKLPKASLTGLKPMLRNSPNPLTLWLGSPSYKTDTMGTSFAEFRSGAIKGEDPYSAWIEYSAPKGADYEDPEVWRQANPALEAGRITERVMAADIADESMSLSEIMVEYLGSWEAENRETVVSMPTWHGLTDPLSRVIPSGDIVVAADADPKRQQATIAVAGYDARGKRHVEIIESQKGITWVQDVLTEIHSYQGKRLKKVIIDKKCSLNSFSEDLIKAGVPVAVTDYVFMANASTNFITGVEQAAFSHRGDDRLAFSITAATERSLNGVTAFRSAEGGDITPLISAALALEGVKSERAEVKNKKKTNAVYRNGKWIT